MQTIQNCYCCGKSDFQLFFKAKDNYAKEYFDIVQCKDCGFVFTNPRPDDIEIGKYYSSPEYMSHNSHSGGLIQHIYRYARKYMMRKKLEIIQQSVNKKQDFSLLDFGCGTGDFLKYIQSHEIMAEGIEPDAQARAVAKSVNQLNIFSIEDAAALLPGKYDVITLWHVLEHVHDLHAQIALFNVWLKPGGVLMIAVPNIESLDAKKYGKYWDALDVPRHLYHFSPNTIKKIVTQHQFTSIEQHPLLLDAYYVSLRSEWHRGTNRFLSYLKAVFSGLKSNNSATLTGNYSSLIYVFKKA